MEEKISYSLALLLWSWFFISFKVGQRWINYHRFGKVIMIVLWFISFFVTYYVIQNLPRSY